MYETIGCSYRLNGKIHAPTKSTPWDPDYNLCGKRKSWAPSPTRFIMMHEADGYAWDGSFIHWHSGGNGQMIAATALPSDPAKFIVPTLFLDGHAKAHNFTSTFKNNGPFTLEPTKDWIWYKPDASSPSP
jgi:hypothetical protein